MTPPPDHPLIPGHRRADPVIVLCLAANALLLGWMAPASAHAGIGLGLAFAGGACGLWGATRPLQSRYARPSAALALVGLVLGQIAIASDPLPWLLNVPLTLSLLPLLQRSVLVALGGAAFLVGVPALAWAAGHPIDPASPIALAYGAVVLSQTALLTAVAHRNSSRTEESPGPSKRGEPPTEALLPAAVPTGPHGSPAADLSASRRLAAAVIQIAAQPHAAAAASPAATRPDDGSDVSLS
jgi:hypothetical protein